MSSRAARRPTVMALPDDVRALLAAPNIAHLATLLPDGGPHAVPIWVGVEDDRVAFMIQRQKLRGLMDELPPTTLSANTR